MNYQTIDTSRELIVRHLSHDLCEVYLNPTYGPVLTYTMIKQMRMFQDQMVEEFNKMPWSGHKLIFWHSAHATWFSKGLDLFFITSCLEEKNNALLDDYLSSLFDILFLNQYHLSVPVFNIFVVTGKIAGIGRELVSVSDVMIRTFKKLTGFVVLDAAKQADISAVFPLLPFTGRFIIDIAINSFNQNKFPIFKLLATELPKPFEPHFTFDLEYLNSFKQDLKQYFMDHLVGLRRLAKLQKLL